MTKWDETWYTYDEAATRHLWGDDPQQWSALLEGLVIANLPPGYGGPAVIQGGRIRDKAAFRHRALRCAQYASTLMPILHCNDDTRARACIAMLEDVMKRHLRPTKEQALLIQREREKVHSLATADIDMPDAASSSNSSPGDSGGGGGGGGTGLPLLAIMHLLAYTLVTGIYAPTLHTTKDQGGSIGLTWTPLVYDTHYVESFAKASHIMVAGFPVHQCVFLNHAGNAYAKTAGIMAVAVLASRGHMTYVDAVPAVAHFDADADVRRECGWVSDVASVLLKAIIQSIVPYNDHMLSSHGTFAHDAVSMHILPTDGEIIRLYHPQFCDPVTYKGPELETGVVHAAAMDSLIEMVVGRTAAAVSQPDPTRPLTITVKAYVVTKWGKTYRKCKRK